MGERGRVLFFVRFNISQRVKYDSLALKFNGGSRMLELVDLDDRRRKEICLFSVTLFYSSMSEYRCQSDEQKEREMDDDDMPNSLSVSCSGFFLSFRHVRT